MLIENGVDAVTRISMTCLQPEDSQPQTPTLENKQTKPKLN